MASLWAWGSPLVTCRWETTSVISKREQHWPLKWLAILAMCLCVAVLVWREFLVVMRILNRSQSSLNENRNGKLGWRQDHRLRVRWLLWLRLNLKGDFFFFTSWRSDLHWLSFVLGSKAWLLTVSPQPSVRLRALSVSPTSFWELTLCS